MRVFACSRAVQSTGLGINPGVLWGSDDLVRGKHQNGAWHLINALIFMFIFIMSLKAIPGNETLGQRAQINRQPAFQWRCAQTAPARTAPASPPLGSRHCFISDTLLKIRESRAAVRKTMERSVYPPPSLPHWECRAKLWPSLTTRVLIVNKPPSDPDPPVVLADVG